MIGFGESWTRLLMVPISRDLMDGPVHGEKALLGECLYGIFSALCQALRYVTGGSNATGVFSTSHFCRCTSITFSSCFAFLYDH